jgi:hypothetical protein
LIFCRKKTRAAPTRTGQADRRGEEQAETSSLPLLLLFLFLLLLFLLQLLFQ